MRLKVQITPTTIGLTLCGKLSFNYSLGSSSAITVASTSTPNQKCNKADESVYFNYILSAATYNMDSEGLITLVDGSNKSIVSLVPQWLCKAYYQQSSFYTTITHHHSNHFDFPYMYLLYGSSDALYGFPKSSLS